MDEMVSEKDFKKHDKMVNNNNNKNDYQNDVSANKKKNKKNKEEKLQMEMEKDIDEKEALMSNDSDGQTPSVVEELSSFIDDQYEQMDRNDDYVNS